MKFRKKPVVIEAWQNTHTPRPIPLWLNDAWRAAKVQFAGGGHIDIHTLEGVMRAELDDWIICGVKGELYPCKPDIFEATYEAADLYDILEQGALVYSLSGTQPTSNIPDGWLRAIDEALVVAHIGVANESDTFEQAREKLDNLIGFHVDVATDPAVNGGYKLVTIEPTKSFYRCFSAYDGTAYSNPFDYDDFVKDWREALEATPEAKP